MSTWDDKPNDYAHALAIIDRLRAALREIIDLDHHNHGPQSRATKIARAALSE